MDDEVREFIEAVMREMWVEDVSAREAMEWAIENIGRSRWIAVGEDPVEGFVGEAPPERVWRLN